MTSDFIVIGGGTVGAAIGYGLARLGRRVTILDGADTDLRAARTNFGLVWVQGKGEGMSTYQALTRRSSDLWPGFAAELQDETGIDMQYSRPGGLVFCLSEGELAEEGRIARIMAAQAGDGGDGEILDRAQLERLVPRIRFGDEIVGASFGRRDGHVNPLLLLRALLKAFGARGGIYRPNASVQRIEQSGGTFRVDTGAGSLEAGRVVVAAGNGSPALMRMLHLPGQVRPQRGQLLITEKVEPVFPFAALNVRQTGDGTFQLGGTQEEVGLDTGITADAAMAIASRAVRIIPALAALRVVRQWAGLRVLSPDGFPIYDVSRQCPGASVILCHSGVTLAAAHAGEVAGALSNDGLAQAYRSFAGSRFGGTDAGAAAGAPAQ